MSVTAPESMHEANSSASTMVAVAYHASSAPLPHAPAYASAGNQVLIHGPRSQSLALAQSLYKVDRTDKCLHERTSSSSVDGFGMATELASVVSPGQCHVPHVSMRS